MVITCILVIALTVLSVFSFAGFQKNVQMEKKMKEMQKQTETVLQQIEETKKTQEELKKAIETVQQEKEAEEETKEEEEAKPEAEEKADEEAKAEKNGKKVTIDPGHQGSNVDMSALEPSAPGSSEMKPKASTGTQGRFTGVPEYELTLNISKQLRTELEARGYEVVLTREDNDTAISNSERATLAYESGSDIFVRIHADGNDSSSVNGAMTMVPSANNAYVGNLHDACQALGQAVIDEYCSATGIKNNGVQIFDNMTGINWSKIPVIILEMGFMTNQSDDENMQNPEFQVQMVQGIANGIDKYFGIGEEA